MRKRKLYGLTGLVILASQLILPFVPEGSDVVKAADPPTRIYINFETSSPSYSAIELPSSASTSSTKSINFDVTGYGSGNPVSATLNINGLSKPASIVSGKLVAAAFDGAKTDVYGRAETDPGHRMYRLPTGKGWEHKALTTATAVRFYPDSTDFVEGVSQYPGLIPTGGERVDDGKSFAYRDDKGGTDLRYKYNNPVGEKVMDYSKEGWAVTYSTSSPKPSYYWKSDLDVVNETGEYYGSDRVVSDSTKIYGTEADGEKSPDALGFYWDSDSTGVNTVRVMRLLSGSLQVDRHYQILVDSEGTNYGQDRNYFMSVKTKWTAYTYLYKGYADITYETPLKPDLAVVDLKVDVDCIEAGTTQAIKYSFKNNGVSTSASFEIQLKLDGVVKETKTVEGANTGILLGGSYNYTFADTGPKDFTFNVNSNNAIDEGGLTSNNTVSKTFQAQASCKVKSDLEGKLTVDQAFIPWKSNNMFEIVIDNNDTATCQASKLKFILTDSAGTVYETAYYDPIDVRGKPGTFEIFAWQGTKYPGNITAGPVSVQGVVRDSCDGFLQLGPKPFIIGDPPPNQPPELQIGWFNSSMSAQISEAIVGDTVGVKVISVHDPDGDPVTTTWKFSGYTGSSAWVGALPAARGLASPYTSSSYGGFSATTKGSHKICATATDNRGGSTTACEYLDVIGPEPIPVIYGSTVVREGRVLDPPLDADSSYSPVPGRTINHAKDEWVNKQSVYYTPGNVVVTLKVFDNTDLKSDETAKHTIIVNPDLPPVIDFDYRSSMTRSEANFRNRSYSPDGDTIVGYSVTWGYDAGNNGSCNPYENFISNSSSYFTFTPPRVGNYCFNVYAIEDYGKSASKVFTMNVINDNPDAEFTATGIATEPAPINVAGYSPSVLKTWANTSLDSASVANGWGANSEGSLVSPRRKITDTTASFPSLNDAVLLSKIQQGNMPSCGDRGFPAGPCVAWNTVDSLRYSYIGNNKFIGDGGKDAGNVGYSHYFYLMGTDMVGKQFPLFPDFQVPFGGGFSYYSNMSWAKNEFTDEFMVYSIIPTSNSYSGGSGGDYYSTNTERYQVYRLSDLRNGNITYLRGGTFLEQFHERLSSADIQRTGTKSNWSDGSYVKSGDYLPFDKDFKKINLTARTVSSYRNKEATPYKVESYTNMPSVARYSRLMYCNSTKFPDFCSSDGNDSYLSAVPNNNGDYFLFGLDKKMYKFDRETGMPSLLWDSSGFPSEDKYSKTVTPDGNYISLYFPGYHYYVDGDDGSGYWVDEPSDQKYVILASGVITTWIPPSAFDTFATLGPKNTWDANSFTVGQSGWGTMTSPTIGLGDVNAGHMTGTGTLPGIIYNEDTIVDSSTGSIYSYTPETAQTPITNEYYTYGQLINPYSQQVVNGTVSWNMRTSKLNYLNMSAGVGFRIQDHKNMYRLESYRDSLRLVRIVNGRKTILSSVNRSSINSSWVSYKIRLTGTRIKVYEGNGLAIDVTDGTFSSGTMGPYSTTDNAEFKGLNFQWSDADLSYDTAGTSIVDTAVTYEVTYKDPENDPRLDPATQWHYEQISTQRAIDLYLPYSIISATKLLDANDGKSGDSALNNSTVTNPVLTFDKVGVYKIDYRVKDDPHPDHRQLYGDGLFADYAKYSDWYPQSLIVHRRPLSIYAVALNEYGRVDWNDSSYDPDRCYNTGNCQAEYAYNHGIYNEKYYYITPSGVLVNGQLIRPQESGTYTIAKAVGDEYRAWSDWNEQTIDVPPDVLPPPNNPPTVELTFPNGTYAAPSPVTLLPTITWNQFDIDVPTTFTTFDIEIKDIWGSCIECMNNRIMNTSSNSWSWTMDTPLQIGGQYSVQVRTSDGESKSDWSNIGWMITNRPPSAVMAVPDGSQWAPTFFDTVRPKFEWDQSDPDPGTNYTYAEFDILYEDGTPVLPTIQHWQGTTANHNSFTIGSDLPSNRLLQIRVRVTDGYAWSAWSPYTWFIINRAPSASVTFPSGTESDPTIVLNNFRPVIGWNQSDPDTGYSFSYYQIQVAESSGGVVYDSGMMLQNTTSGTNTHTPFIDLPAGKNLMVRVKVWDQYGADSGWSPYKWLYINRPPIAAFTWKVNPPVAVFEGPAWEGDHIQLINQSTDPDIHTITSNWSIRNPSGQTSSYTEDPFLTFVQPGNYEVTLTVTDIYGVSSSLTRIIGVSEMVILGYVNHTDDWNANRKRYNQSKTRTDESPRGYEVFFPGERFLLKAATLGNVIRTTSQILGTSFDTEMNKASGGTFDGIWTGELWDETMLRWDNQNVTFRFTVHTPTGYTKIADVQVTIDDDGYWRQHRSR